ncbi:hypothetical protein BDZ89DRAFT_1077751 [Hymenopellis radicata]|nr:hypothetical protein BDZ89DRAFT_1077751 [Hymenopellis radicata]
MDHAQYIVNHVFMPLKLPQADEQTVGNYTKDHSLAECIAECAAGYSTAAFQATGGHTPSSYWPAILRMLQGVARIHGSRNYTTENTTALLIREQNAGVIFRVLESNVRCEVFEVSAPNAAIMACENKVVWTFPGPSTSFPRTIFDTVAFRRELASFIAQMNCDELPGSATHSRKAGSSQIERRDTAHPRYISDLLICVLAALGGEGNPIVDAAHRVQKRIADDVLWRDALAPWRRSSLWLVIRVAIQTTLENLWEYKAFLLYAMSDIALKIVTEQAWTFDKLHCFDPEVPLFVFEQAKSACTAITGELWRRWAVMQVADIPTYESVWAPQSMDLVTDAHLTLGHSSAYIQRALTSIPQMSSSSFYQPSHSPRLRSRTINDVIMNNGLRGFTSSDDAYTNVADFEDMVCDELTTWTDSQLTNPLGPCALEILIKDYSRVAEECYKGNAEQQSLMILTILDLWVALDRIVITQLPLLADYPPEVPLTLLESLLLRRRKELARAKALHLYLSTRLDRSIAPSVFSQPSSSSFAVRHYGQTSELIARRKEIEEQAHRQRRKKEAELDQQNGLRAQYQSEYDGAVHNENCGQRKVHCDKCETKRKMDKMKVQLHEWPLPSNELKLKTALFELYCPKPFIHWRETTYFILRDKFTERVDKKSEINDQLAPYMKKHISYDRLPNRITLASVTKSWLRTHYNPQSIPSTSSAVCLSHGLTWQLYDDKRGILISMNESAHQADVSARCTLQLPHDHAYHNLQWAVDSTTHTENEVLARQHECHRDLSLHEFISFGCLRAGSRVQWMNVARDFAGTFPFLPLPSCPYPRFADLLFVPVFHPICDGGSLDSYSDNWQEVVSVKTVVVVVTRMLSSIVSFDLPYDGLLINGVLSRARQITYSWLQSMLNELERTPQEHNLAILVHCAIVLKDNREAQRDRSSSSPSRILLDRVEWMLHALQSRLSSVLKTDSSGLDRAVQRVWAAYEFGTPWEVMPSPNDRWLMCQTSTSQYVQVNILDGALLVDGKPIGNLSSNITEHPTYRRIFSNAVLRVIPAGEAGFDYKTVVNVSGNQVFFALRQDELVVEARSSSLDAPETRQRYIPHTYFVGDLPTPLVASCTHWLDLSSGQIELRPLESLWTSSPRNWRLNFPLRVMQDAQERRLLEMDSRSFRMIHQRLREIESLSFFIMCTSNNTIDIQLPRLQLDFQTEVVSGAALRCCTYPKYIVDEGFAVGTLTGLKSKLVLREHFEVEGLCPKRRILIPYGGVVVEPCQDHVTVSVTNTKEDQTFIPHAEYGINEQLGTLVGNGTLRSNLFKVLLHALTSYPLPDQLTDVTGVEEALNVLSSAACMSFQYLGDNEMQLLEEIRALTPQHTFYPKDKQVMQTIHWSNRPSCSQITAFELVVQHILDFNKQLNDLFYDNVLLNTRDPTPPILARRAAAREHLYPLVNLRDVVSRPSCKDTSYSSHREACHYPIALMTSALDARRFPIQQSPTSLYEIFESWGSLKLIPESTSQNIFSYNRYWITKPEFGSTWLDMYLWCTERHAIPEPSALDDCRFTLIFSLAAFAYEHYLDSWSKSIHVLPYFVLFTVYSRQLTFPTLPPRRSYDLTVGLAPSQSHIQDIIRRHVRLLAATPSANFKRSTKKKNKKLRQKHYDEQVKSYSSALLSYLIGRWDPSCWITSIPTPQDRKYADYLNLDQILVSVCDLFQKCRYNIDLHAYTERVDSLFQGLGPASHSSPYPRLPPRFFHNLKRGTRPSFDGISLPVLLKGRHVPGLFDAEYPTLPLTNALDSEGSQTDESTSVIALHRLLNRVRASGHRLHGLYADNVKSSLEHHRKATASRRTLLTITQDLKAHIGPYYSECDAACADSFCSLVDALRPRSMMDVILDCGGLWPSLGPRVWLFQMTKARWASTEERWQNVLGVFSSTLLQVQQAARLKEFLMLIKVENCKPLDLSLVLEHPDWTLIQIEGNFRARDIQIAVAREMFSPTSSISLQLNMGEGKSSVIAPMLAASLSNGDKLVRMVVLKPLAPQMFQLMTERLSFLPNRRIFYLPFSRQMKITQTQLRQIRLLAEECARVGGILVSQPEHILSAKLLAVDKMLSIGSGCDEGLMLDAVRFHRLQHEHSRDILDECDELLHPRYQLIYTMGKQVPMEGQPYRWQVTQDVLRVVSKHILVAARRLGTQLEVHSASAWSFPHFKFPTDDDSLLSALIEDVADDIMGGSLPSFNTTHLGAEVLSDIRHFVCSDNDAEDTQLLLQQRFGHETLFNVFLILRGLFGRGILSYVLRDRRWRIDYGLDPSRTLLAVPYRAKDVPSPRAEFGHPDIAIILTCLAYYYTGLTTTEVDACLRLLFLDSNPSVLYETWIAAIPPSEREGLNEVGAVNLNDAEQHARIVSLFHHCHAVIDFYLSDVVFPKAAKQFPDKLPTSAWDLGERKPHATAGFSGTKDNEYLLPTSISQVDPVNQAGTNAMVLTYLLQPENAQYTCTRDSDSGKSLSGTAFVDMLATEHPEIRVLLDIGAQMLDLNNQDLAKRWLSKRSDVEAVVFFSQGDELMVLRRDGTKELLNSSPYRQHLSSCLVYLDDAHTRGTDLKLPIDWKAAVTLGRKVTKDRLVQGCMRMRQLGRGQSLHFFAQPDIDTLIKKMCAVDSITVADIVQWTMLETCADIEHHAPQWAQQGIDFKQRRACLDALPAAPTRQDIRQVRDVWLQPEARPLLEMYGDYPSASQADNMIRNDPEIYLHLQRLGVFSSGPQDVDEEQEREVDHEMEVERQVERPSPVSSATHQLDDDVKAFVRTGRIPSSSSAFLSPCRVISSLPHSSNHSNNFFHPNLLVTRDYAVTVKGMNTSDKGSVDFLKDVHWLLCANGPPPVVVVISQFEANELMPVLRTDSVVRLHIYSPRVTRSMQVFDSLTFYSVPHPAPLSFEALIPQLNIFAGQLYPTCYADFKAVSAFLGIVGAEDKHVPRERDGFVKAKDRAGDMEICPFQVSPLALLQELLATRRRGQGYALTPMGKLVRGLPLCPEDIE